MGTIADKLNYALGTKTAIKNAIIEKGQTITDETFRAYAQKILAIAGGGVIQPLSVTANGTYTAPEGVDGYSPVTVNVSGGGNANIHWYFPRICEGDIHIKMHSDCELTDVFDASNYTLSDKFTNISGIDNLNIEANLHDVELDSVITMLSSPSAYKFNNGTPGTQQLQINKLTWADVTEPIADSSVLIPRTTVSRMTVVRNNSYLDYGQDAISLSHPLPGIDFPNTAITTLYLNADSYMSCTGLQISINQRDAASYYIWYEEGAIDGVYYTKVRWKGASHYAYAVDQEWEIVCLTNGDFIIRLIKLGTSTDGTFSFKGNTLSLTENSTTACYRRDYWGTTWEIINEPYTLAHHQDFTVWVTAQFTNVSSILIPDSALPFVNNVGHDDDVVAFAYLDNFSWHSSTYLWAGGNSFLGLTANAEQVTMVRRDSKMYYLYETYYILSDMNNLRCVQVTWKGASSFSGSIDRLWSVWLFANGDAMIHIDTIGANTDGSSSFFGQTYTAADNSYISFYYDSTAGNYDIKYEVYTLEHHIG